MHLMLTVYIGYTARRGLVLKVAMAKGGNKARTEPEESTKPSILESTEQCTRGRFSY